MKRQLSMFVITATTLACLLAAKPSEALLNWDWDFTNSGGTYDPTADVTALARLTNNSTEGETIGDFVADYFINSASAYPILDPVYTFDFGPAPDHFFFDQFNGLALAPGDSFDFTFGVYTPQAGGAPEGPYDTFGGLSIAQFQDNEVVNQSSIQDKPFSWTVQQNTGGELPSAAVPEPASLVLLAGGFAALAGLRRRKA